MSTQEPTLAPSGDVEAMKARVLAQPLIAALVRAIETVDPDLAAEMRSASPTSPDEKMPAFLDALDREWAALHPQATAPLAGQEFDAGELAGELERLDREATPGPWRVGTWGNGEHVPGLEHIFLDTIEATIQDVLAEDAALIVALRNNLPTIITVLRSTQQPDLLPLLREARDVLRQTDIESAHLTLSGETREQIRRALAHLDATLAQEGEDRG